MTKFVAVDREHLQTALNYIKHCGSNQIFRGEPHPQQQIVDWLESALAAAPETADHPDELAVDLFATAMKEKLALKRARGRSGWDDPSQCTVKDLTEMLEDHRIKGDMVDEANFCMMIWNREHPADQNAAGQLPHGVCRADDPNGEANGIAPSHSQSQIASADATDRNARGVVPSVSDDSTGTPITVPAAPETAGRESRADVKYRCVKCGCFWRSWPPTKTQDSSWSLWDADQKPYKVCDNGPKFLCNLEPVVAAPDAATQHVLTEQCGYDRNASLSENRYVCMCGWYDGKPKADSPAKAAEGAAMTPIEALKSVLCDLDGKCCIAGSDEDKRIIDDALADLIERLSTKRVSEGEIERITNKWFPLGVNVATQFDACIGAVREALRIERGE